MSNASTPGDRPYFGSSAPFVFQLVSNDARPTFLVMGTDDRRPYHTIKLPIAGSGVPLVTFIEQLREIASGLERLLCDELGKGRFVPRDPNMGEPVFGGPGGETIIGYVRR